MVLMFISGCLRYAERTLCLYNASTAKLTESSLVALRDYAKELEDGDNKDREYHGFIPKEYVVQTAEACSRDYELIIDNMFKADGRQLSFDLLPDISSSAAALVSATPLSNLAAAEASPNRIQRKLKQLKSSAHRCRTYNYVGAITLEASSLFITFALSEQAPHRIQSAVWRVGKYVYPAWGTKQWSEMLWQYNMINSVTKQDDAGIMSLVPQWISKHLYDKTITHIDIYENLKKSVLDKLLEFGTRKEDWNFASFRGQLALRGRKSNHGPLSFLLPAKPETPLLKSINDVDFPTTVLIWHIATDILFFQDNSASNTSSYPQMKMSKEISNYVMYLVFKCGVMITNTTELQHDNALKVMEANRGLGAEGAINKVFQANKLLKRTSKSHVQPLLPHACKVAQELIDIPGEANRWDLITAVWLEMLFYIAPRCGGSFHSEHLATGGEFITHVLLLMHFLGPFLKPQGIELLCAK
ncbi:uncharacterized protein [Lolium perenne]|uniref:uncharacterized protein n=1 Tax=Lolium perenne TaxID=4522 RepID=UPI003A9A1B71